MKFNKWTLGLAAVGAISLTSAARADEPKLSPLNVAESDTTISGVVDIGAEYATGNVHNDYYSGYSSAASYYNYGLNGGIDNFSVNQVLISLDKPLDASPWASGYHIDLNWGTSAVMPLNSTYDYGYYSNENPLRQAYVTMRTPVGSGITWKAGLFDNILGYESNTLVSNPNYSHSYGWNVEPTSQLGLIGTYNIADWVSVTAGLANTYYQYSVSDKTYLGAVTFTAPDSFGWAKGAALTLGVNQGFYKYAQNNYYAGLTLPTPISALKVGLAFDLVGNINEYPNNNPQDDSEWIVGAYASYQATDKLSVNVRGEYNNGYGYPYDNGIREEVTITTAYNLWANVTSRVELRWDHADEGTPLGYPGYDSSGAYDGARSDDFTIAFNVAYTF